MTKEIEKTNNPVTLQSLLEGDEFKSKVAATLPKHLTPERFVRIAVAALNRTPKLRQCTPASFFKCLIELSSYGLEPDGRRAHLIPFANRKKNIVECTLIPDYKGLAEMAMRSGIIKRIHADVIYENDEFEYDMGEIKRHKVNFMSDRGNPIGAYALAETKDGSMFTQVMTKDQIEAVRDSSQGYRQAVQYGNDTPWIDHWSEMWKKTPFKRMSKWLPLSAEFRDAVDKEDEREFPQDRFEHARDVTETRNAFEAALENTAPEIEEAEQEPTEEEEDAKAEADFFKAGEE